MVKELGDTVKTLRSLNAQLNRLYNAIGSMDDGREKLRLTLAYKKVHDSMSTHVDSTVDLIQFMKDETAKDTQADNSKQVVKDELLPA